MSRDNQPQKLALFGAKFLAASAAHKDAERMAEHAKALDASLEIEAAEHGIEFEEIVRAAMDTAAVADGQVIVH